MPVEVITLEAIKADPNKITDSKVLIYSREHGAYWRDNYAGYTTRFAAAGIYSFKDAFQHTSHCGPEKGIEFEVLQ